MRALIPLALFGLMGWLVFIHPTIFQHLVTTVIALGFLFFFLLFGVLFYIQYRQNKGRPVKGVTVNIQHSIVPFLGLAGTTSLSVRREGSKLFVSMSRFEYLWLLAVLLFFGPGMIGAYLLHMDRFNAQLQHFNGPIYVMIALPAMIALATYLFCYYFRQMFWMKPVVEISPEGIRLWRGHHEIAVMHQRDITGFGVDISKFRMGNNAGSNYYIDNYTLYATLESGKRQGLCITSNKAASETLKQDMERMMRISASVIA